METLQFTQYYYLDRCGEMENYMLTVFAHILVVIQPFMWNRYRMICHQNVGYRMMIFHAMATMSLIWAIFYTLRLYPVMVIGKGIITSPESLHLDEIMVGREVCTRKGPFHLIWQLPYYSRNGLEPNYFTYLLLWFFPSIYEKKKGYYKLLYWIMQITLVNVTSGNIHELPTTWCALSVPILFVILLFDI